MKGPVFAPPNEEGARRALPALRARGGTVEVARHCAVVIDVYDREDVLIQRAIAHADVPKEVKRAFAEVVDRCVSRFSDSQLVDRLTRGSAGPYRGSALATNEIAGFDYGFAAAVARERVTRLRDSLRSGPDLDVRMYAVPFLLSQHVQNGYVERAVIIRRDDGTYEHEEIEAVSVDED